MDLEFLRAANSTLELAFFGISLGSLITVATTLVTVTLGDPVTHAVFVALTCVLTLSSAYLGLAAARGEMRWRKKIKEWIDRAEVNREA
jgi:hypothetical protein